MIWQVTRSYRTNYAPVQAFAVDHLNQLINVSRAATLRTLTAPASTTSPATIVTVEGASATLYADNTFPRAGVIITNGVEVHTAIAQASYRRSDTSSVSVTLPSWVSFERDPNGTLTYDGHRRFAYDNLDRLSGRWTYTWDAENRLVQMVANANVPLAAKRKLEFEYDWIGRRIRKTVWTTSDGVNYVNPVATKYLYDGWNLIAELDENNALVRSYIWGLDLSGTLQGAGGVGGLLAVKPATGPAQFVCYDLNGNVTALVDASTGAATAQYEYDSFGEVIRSTGPMARVNPFRWSTQYTDDETDLVCYLHRYYNPSTGRWLNRDPLGELGFTLLKDKQQVFIRKTVTFQEFVEQLNVLIAEPGGANRYAFVGNDPIRFYDLLGLKKAYSCDNGIHTFLKFDDGTSYGFWPEKFTGRNMCCGKGVLKSPDPDDGPDAKCTLLVDAKTPKTEAYYDCLKKTAEDDFKNQGMWYSVFGRNCQTWSFSVRNKCMRETLMTP